MKKPIYLDYNATTPHDPEVIDAMRPFLEEEFGNPSSSHWYGTEPKKAVMQARSQVASLLNCKAEEIIFTSGGTESNNHAILGVARAMKANGRHIVTSSVEHPAVLESAVIGKADVVVPRGLVAELVARVKATASKLGISIACFGHAGGNRGRVDTVIGIGMARSHTAAEVAVAELPVPLHHRPVGIARAVGEGGGQVRDAAAELGGRRQVSFRKALISWWRSCDRSVRAKPRTLSIRDSSSGSSKLMLTLALVATSVASG